MHSMLSSGKPASASTSEKNQSGPKSNIIRVLDVSKGAVNHIIVTIVVNFKEELYKREIQILK